jgi:hypothetical protein
MVKASYVYLIIHYLFQNTLDVGGTYQQHVSLLAHSNIKDDSFGTRPKKMRISQRLFIRF